MHRLEVTTVVYNTIQYNTIQYNTIQYNTIQYNTIQYNTTHRTETCLSTLIRACIGVAPRRLTGLGLDLPVNSLQQILRSSFPGLPANLTACFPCYLPSAKVLIRSCPALHLCRLPQRALQVRDFAAAAQAREDARASGLRALLASVGVNVPAASVASNAVGNADDMECCICLDAPEEPMASPCGHVFCKQCIRDALSQERRCVGFACFTGWECKCKAASSRVAARACLAALACWDACIAASGKFWCMQHGPVATSVDASTSATSQANNITRCFLEANMKRLEWFAAVRCLG
jgi:hypothetical protein